jgi:hypothetical protein
MSRYKAIVCLLLAATACGPVRDVPTQNEKSPVIVESVVQAELVAGGVRVTNGSTSTISLHVLNSNWLGQLVPCNAAQSRCTTLDPGAQTVVPSSQIYGLNDPATDPLVVYYWRPGDELPTEIAVTRN